MTPSGGRRTYNRRAPLTGPEGRYPSADLLSVMEADEEGELSPVRSPVHAMLLLGIAVFSVGVVSEGVALALSSGLARWALLVGLVVFLVGMVLWMRMWGEEPVALGTGAEGLRVITRSAAYVVPWTELAVSYHGRRPASATFQDRRRSGPWGVRGAWVVLREDAERIIADARRYDVRFE